jgi:tetratricopeptide (TPR) repeat protein
MAPGARTSSGGTLSPELARDALVAKLWTECEVFQRYGLKAKVVEQLRRILELEPSHVGARERLKDALIDRGDFVAAAAELHALADLHSDEPAAAALYLREILLLDPLDASAKHRLARTAERPAPLASELTSPEVEEFEGEKTVFEASESADAEPFAPPTLERPLEPATAPDDEEFSIDTPSPRTGAPVAVDADEEAPTDGADSGASDDGRADPETMSDEDAGADELFFVDDGPNTGAQTVEQSVSDDDEESTLLNADLVVSTSEFPPVTTAPSRTDGDLLAPMSPEEFERAPVLAAASEAGDEVPTRAVHAGGDVEDLLDEADFYVAQGLFDDARAMLEEAVRAYPRNRLIADKLADLDEVLAARSRASKKAPAREDHSFALAERLAADLDGRPAPDEDAGGDVLDVDHVFSQFKKGVEAQVSPDDVATHFDLGIAYKEMGLVVDAMAEFERCTGHPEKECIAHAMLGVCHFEQGAYAEAIAQFKKGLHAEAKTEREETGLHFELGCAYQASGDPREALYYFDKVRKRDASFRNVGDRIAALARDVASAPATAASSVDDVDAAFDDLMGDDL